MLQEALFQDHRVVRGAILPPRVPVASAAVRRAALTLSQCSIDPSQAPLIWDVTHRDGLEYERFDDAESIYVLGTDGGEACAGGWRLRPTDRGCMLGEVFTQLLAGAPIPSDPGIWEISRFVINAPHGLRAHPAPRWQARMVLREAVRFAIEHQIRRYVLVVSLAVERLIARSGVIVHRFASPARIGRTMSVACWIDIDPHTRRLLLDQAPTVSGPP